MSEQNRPRPEDVDLGKGSHEQQQGSRNPADGEKNKSLPQRPERPTPGV